MVVLQKSYKKTILKDNSSVKKMSSYYKIRKDNDRDKDDFEIEM